MKKSAQVNVEKIEERRKLKGLSVKEFTAKAGFSPKTYDRMRRDGKCSEDHLTKTAEVLNLDPSQLRRIPNHLVGEDLEVMRDIMKSESEQINGWSLKMICEQITFPIDELFFSKTVSLDKSDQINKESFFEEEHQYIYDIDVREIHQALQKHWSGEEDILESIKKVTVPTLVVDGGDISVYNATSKDLHVQTLLLGDFFDREFLVNENFLGAVTPQNYIKCHFLPRPIPLGDMAMNSVSIQLSSSGIASEIQADLVGALFDNLITLMNWEETNFKKCIRLKLEVSNLISEIENKELRVFSTIPFKTGRNDLIEDHSVFTYENKLHVAICPLSHPWVVDPNRCLPHTNQGDILGVIVNKKSTNILPEENTDVK